MSPSKERFCSLTSGLVPFPVISLPAVNVFNPVPPFVTDRTVPDQFELFIELNVANEPNPRLVLVVEGSDTSNVEPDIVPTT